VLHCFLRTDPPNRNTPVADSVAERKGMTTTTVTATNRHASMNADKADAVFEAYRAEGLTIEKDGEEKASTAKLGERVCAVMLQRAIVRNKSEIQKNAIAPGDLTAIVFPSTTNPASPGWPDDDDDSDDAEITRNTWGRVQGDVSKAVQTGRKGSVQRTLASNPETSELIVCATKIGTKPAKAVYLSDDKDMILLGLAMPRTTKLNTLSANIADDFNYAIGLNSKLKRALNEKMETGLKAARDTARAKLALTSGDEDES
jgi:hypothetical protein